MLRWWISILVVAVSAGVLGAPVGAELGSSAADLVFTPLTPCRIIDTRVVGGPIVPGLPRDFVVGGTQGFEAQGGHAGGCGIPDAATAAMLNFIAVDARGPGDLRAWPFGQPVPLRAAGRASTTIRPIAAASSVPSRGVPDSTRSTRSRGTA